MKQRKPTSVKRTAAGKRRQTKRTPPRNAEQYFSMPQRTQDVWDGVVNTLAKMRNGLSLQQASREVGISSRTVLKLGHSALRKGSNGRYKATRSDTFLRLMRVPAPDGTREVLIKGSREARHLSGYWSALHVFLQTGNRFGLEAFRGKSINSVGGPVSLPVDGAEIMRLASAQVLSFESIYGRSM
jgi:hypothetical protein